MSLDLNEWLGDAIHELSPRRQQQLGRALEKISPHYPELALSTATMFMLGDITLEQMAERWSAAPPDRAQATRDDLEACIIAAAEYMPVWRIAQRTQLGRRAILTILRAQKSGPPPGGEGPTINHTPQPHTSGAHPRPR